MKIKTHIGVHLSPIGFGLVIEWLNPYRVIVNLLVLQIVVTLKK